MNWLYWNYIINSWNYIKQNWRYLKENWNELDYKSKRCVYLMLIVFISILSAPILPRLYTLSRKQMINIVSFVEPNLKGLYYPEGRLSIHNHINRSI